MPGILSNYLSKQRSKKVLPYLKGDILDVGCGPGFNSVYLKDKFINYIGIDYSEEFIKIAKSLHSNGIFVAGNVKSLKALNLENPDLIIGIGILHHIDNLNEALMSLKEIAKNDTVLAFSEPFRGNPGIQLLRYFRKKIDPDYSKDQVFFSKRELVDLFNNNGFEVKNVKYQGFFSTPFAQVVLKPKEFFYPVSKASIIFDRFIQKVIKLPIFWNIQIVAKVKGN